MSIRWICCEVSEPTFTLHSLTNRHLKKLHLVSHDTDSSVELQIVLCHLRYLKFHSDVVQVVVQDGIINGPIITDCRRTAVRKGPFWSKGSRRTLPAYASLCQFAFEVPHVHVSCLVQWCVKVRNVTGKQRLTRFIEVHDLFQHGNSRAVEYRSKLVRRSNHSAEY